MKYLRVKRYEPVVIIILLVLGACANPRPPSGGPKDTTPPRLDSLHSTPNLQTNFVPKEIKLRFDEWVVLQNPATQIITTPPLQFSPDVKLKGKTLLFKFDEREKLKPNTTYVINFGKSIKDLNESNPFEGYNFIFSTGERLDEEKISGKVINAYSGVVEKDVYVMLYSSGDDSIVYRRAPDYFSSTKNDGSFLFEHLRRDSFQIVALRDKNKNFILDLPGEEFGFVPSLVYTTDSLKPHVELLLYRPEYPFSIRSTNQDTFGLYSIRYLGKIDELRIETEPETTLFINKKPTNTLQIYLSNPERAYSIFCTQGDKVDTLEYEVEKHLIKRKLQVEPKLTSLVLSVVNQHAEIRFNQPIKAIDASKCMLVDSLASHEIRDIRAEDSLLMDWVLQIPDSIQSVGNLLFLPGGIRNYYDSINLDTISLPYRVFEAEDLGNISIHIKKLNPKHQYLLKLNGTIARQWVIPRDTVFRVELNAYFPGKYEITIIEDLNVNGRWDGGNYAKKLLPEPLMILPEKELRAQWDLDLEIEWSEDH